MRLINGIKLKLKERRAEGGLDGEITPDQSDTT